MSEEPPIDHAEDLHRQMREAMAGAALSPAVRKRKLLLWGFRQALLCALAWYFWDKTWMRWVFGIGMVIAVVNLMLILLLPRMLAARATKADRQFDRLRATLADRAEEGAD